MQIMRYKNGKFQKSKLSKEKVELPHLMAAYSQDGGGKGHVKAQRRGFGTGGDSHFFFRAV